MKKFCIGLLFVWLLLFSQSLFASKTEEWCTNGGPCSITVEPEVETAVPETTSLSLLAIGIAGVSFLGFKRRDRFEGGRRRRF